MEPPCGIGSGSFARDVFTNNKSATGPFHYPANLIVEAERRVNGGSSAQCCSDYTPGFVRIVASRPRCQWAWRLEMFFSYTTRKRFTITYADAGPFAGSCSEDLRK